MLFAQYRYNTIKTYLKTIRFSIIIIYKQTTDSIISQKIKCQIISRKKGIVYPHDILFQVKSNSPVLITWKFSELY